MKFYFQLAVTNVATYSHLQIKTYSQLGEYLM